MTSTGFGWQLYSPDNRTLINVEYDGATITDRVMSGIAVPIHYDGVAHYSALRVVGGNDGSSTRSTCDSGSGSDTESNADTASSSRSIPPMPEEHMPPADLFKFFSANLLSSHTTAPQKMALPVGYLKTRAEHGLHRLDHKDGILRRYK